MQMSFVDGVLTVSMPHAEFIAALEGSMMAGEVKGRTEGFRRTANGTKAGATRKTAKKAVARRKITRQHVRRVARPQIRRSGKRKDWSAIVAKRLATQAENREKRRLEAQQQQAQSATNTAEAI